MPKKQMRRIIDTKRSTAAAVGGVTSGGGGGGGGVTDHGDLTGLLDDDHNPLYFNQTRGDARYALIADVITDHGLLDGLTDDDHLHYHTDARGDLRYVPLSRTVAAGAGLTVSPAGGQLDNDLTFTLGQPSALTPDTVNLASGTTHEHDILSSNNVSADGAGVKTLLHSLSGAISVKSLTAATSVTTPTVATAAGDLALSPSTGVTVLSTLYANTRVRATLLNTDAGSNMTISPAGDLYLSPAGIETFFSGSSFVGSSNYATGIPIVGWRIGPTQVSGQSGLEMGIIEADELRVRFFVADEVRVDRGQLYLTKSYGILAEQFAVPSAEGGTALIYFENSPSLGTDAALFTAGDYIMLQWVDMDGGASVIKIWGQVTGTPVYSTNADDIRRQQWTFTRRATNSQTYTFGKGAIGIDFGASGASTILLDAVTATAPYMQFSKWVTNPYTPSNFSKHVQIGRLDGVTFTGEFGIAASKTGGWGVNDQWLKISTGTPKLNNLPMEWWTTGIKTVGIDSNFGIDISMAATYGYDRAYTLSNAGVIRAGVFGIDDNSPSHVDVGLIVGRWIGVGLTGSRTNNNLYLRAGGTNAEIATTFVEAWSGDTGGAEAHVSIKALANYNSGVEIETVEFSSSASNNLIVSIVGRLQVTYGTLATPAINLGDADSGIYAPVTGQISLVSNGVSRLLAHLTGVNISGLLDVSGTVTSQYLNYAAGPKLQYNAATKLTVTSTGISVTGLLSVSANANIIGILDVNGNLDISGDTYLRGDTQIFGVLTMMDTVSPGINIGSSLLTTAAAYIQIGSGRSGDGASYIDFIATNTVGYTDYGTRFYQYPGANGALTITHLGTGDFGITNTHAADIVFRTTAIERLRINSDGIIAMPSGVNINVEGTAQFYGTNASWRFMANGATVMSVGYTAGAGSDGRWMHTGYPIKMGTFGGTMESTHILQSTEGCIYFDNNKFIIAYNSGGNTFYFYIPVTTGVTPLWTYSDTPP